MKKKPVLYTEAAYAIGLIILAFGTALTERGGFGISMVVAPAYILYLKISDIFPWYSFGMSEFLLQGVVLAVMAMLVRKLRVVDLLSFVTAVLYGAVLDLSMGFTGLLDFVPPIVLYVVGAVMCSAGIAFFVETYLPPEAYELFVKKISRKCNMSFSKFKTIYDCGSCVIAVALSFILYGGFRGIGVGSVVCALLNGTLVGVFSKLYQKIWNFKDRLSLRSYFEGRINNE